MISNKSFTFRCFISVPLNDQPPYKFRLEFLVRNKQKPSDPFGFYAEYDVVNKTQEERNFTAGIVGYLPPPSPKFLAV